MIEKIKEVHDYFVQCLVNGDYKIVSIEERRVNIIIDDAHEFVLWIASGAKFFSTYSESFMTLKLSEYQKECAYGLLLPHIKKNTTEILIKAATEELDRLKKIVADEK